MGVEQWTRFDRPLCAREGCENSGYMNSSGPSVNAPPVGWDWGSYCSDECMKVGHAAGWEKYRRAEAAHERVCRALGQWWRPLRRRDVRLALQYRSGTSGTGGLW